jgi:hypothetical protein
MSLMAWIVLWAVVTTAVVVLAYYRLTLGLHEVLGIKLGSGHQAEFYDQQLKIERKLDRLDMFGVILTVASALMVITIVILWAIEAGGR